MLAEGFTSVLNMLVLINLFGFAELGLSTADIHRATVRRQAYVSLKVQGVQT